MPAPGAVGLIRRRLVCAGVVQGVGFRPAIWRLARQTGVTGSVRNDAAGATVEVEGPAGAVAAFEAGLAAALPRLARLDTVTRSELPARGQVGFLIEATAEARRGRALTPPDVALCASCRAELRDPADRRRRYPFTNCTDCGPRYSVITALPYDRSATSMACFEKCPTCASEYAAPASRRFHAEPICCPVCGPRLWICRDNGVEIGAGADAIEVARRALSLGEIVAIKGLGGFQLACRADMPEPVARLRARKRRATKPFAVMVRDLGIARRVAVLGAADEAALTGPEGPILLAPRRPDAPVARAVAPGLDDVGILLPTTPLHDELLRGDAPPAIVTTSGNRSDEPICTGNREALRRLRGIADLFLLHDRDIVRRVDDSVVRAMPDGHVVVRRSRGFVPRALPLPAPAAEPVLALGAHLQTTVCVAVGDEAFPSQHVGDLDTESARAFLLEVARGLEDFLDVEGRVVVADLHPDYASRQAAERLARERGARFVAVQHHVAHAAAALADRGVFPRRDERALALVLDGTGWGPDGTAWGCEWLALGGDLVWERAAHGDELALVGGERAVREPWRVAVAALVQAGWDAADVARLPLGELVGPARIAQVAALGVTGWPRATGAGRLFEAAGALCGLATTNTFEGEAAVRFETLAARFAAPVEAWREVVGAERLPSVALLAAAATRLRAGEDAARVARGFHATFCRPAAELGARIADRLETDFVALAGGCMVNRLLAAGLVEEHARVGLTALPPHLVPPGDGGVSFGQAVLAAVADARGVPIPPSCGGV